MNDSKNTPCTLQVLLNSNDVAKISGLRAMANNCLFRAIGLIDIDIRQRRRREDEHRDEGRAEPTAEQRHRVDQDERLSSDPEVTYFGDEPIKDVVGPGNLRKPPLMEASQLFAVYEYCKSELEQCGSTWEQAMSIGDAVNFRLNSKPQSDAVIVELISQMTGIDPKHLRTWNELAYTQEQAQFATNAPEIRATLESWVGESCYAEAFCDLNPVTQHQISVKVAGKLKDRKEKVIIRAMRTRRISDLGDLALLDDGIEQVSNAVKSIEKLHREEILAAMELGRQLTTLEDVLR